METAMTISGIFGPYLLIIGLWMLIQKKNCMKICDSVRKNPAAVHCHAWMSVLIGLVLINVFNVWEANAVIIITLLGWVYFIRGLVVLFIPHVWHKTETHESAYINLGAFIRIIWGLALCWLSLANS
jgi:hypothetical protein